VQRFRALQGDYDVTICVPPLLGEMLLNAVGEKVGHPLLLSRESFVIGRTQLHHVVVAREQPPTGELLNLEVSLALQALGYLLWNNLSAEDTREAIPHDAFEPALEALHEAHGNPSTRTTP
jgi:hypothetical protein